MIVPALYAMVKRGLAVPLIGVASSKWTLTRLCKHLMDSLRRSGARTHRDTQSRRDVQKAAECRNPVSTSIATRLSSGHYAITLAEKRK